MEAHMSENFKDMKATLKEIQENDRIFRYEMPLKKQEELKNKVIWIAISGIVGFILATLAPQIFG